MDKIVVVGSINMDVVIRVPHIPVVGETVIAHDLKNYGGGKGANQAISIARLGGNVYMIGRVGNDEYGQKLYENLKNDGVGVEGIEFDLETPTGTAYINVDENGKNNIVVYQGANKKLSIEQIKKHETIFNGAKFCLLQLEIPIDTVEFVVNLCHSKGIKVILNPAPACELPDGLLEKVYILTPNETELGFLSKMSVGDLEEIKMAGKYLVGKGVQNVITTMGEKGSLFVNKHMEKLFEAINVNAVDTTAAGDSFTGALALALSRGESIEDAIRFATFVAALTVTKEGAQSSLPYKEEVEKFIMERS